MSSSAKGIRIVYVAVIGALVANCENTERSLTLPEAANVLQNTGDKIAFVSNRDGNDEIYVMNTDGTGQTRLTNNAASDVDPAWSPDGARIVFASNRAGPYDIYVMNANGTGVTRLTTTTHPSGSRRPGWCGNRIVFESDRDRQQFPDVFVMNDDGSGVSALTSGGFDQYPTWSPACDRIAYTWDGTGDLEIYAMNADGSGVTRLTNNPGYDESPAWSWDGTKISFTRTIDAADRDIYVMNADGSGVTRLTSAPCCIWDSDPTWSPDGAQIAFQSGRDGDQEIYAMNADGSGVRQLTNNSAIDGSPAWFGAPPSSAWPNEPPGFSVLTDWGFDQSPPQDPADQEIPGSPGPWHINHNNSFPNGANVTLAPDPGAPASPSNTYKFTYPESFPGGESPAGLYYPHATASEVFVGMWWKPSNPWQSHPGSLVNKIAFWFTVDGGNVDIQMFGPQGGPYYLHVVTEFTNQPDARRLEPNVNGVPITLGVWHRIEWYMKYATTPGGSDGVFKWWLDGQLQGNYTDVGTQNDAGFITLAIDPTWGGVGDFKSEEDYYWFDHIHASRR